MKTIRSILALLSCIFVANTAISQRYSVGDVVQNFTLTDRDTGQDVNLTDFEGKIVFLEWFTYWCPYCKAAAEQTKAGIVDYYASRGGNPDGVPVLHIAVNLEPTGEAQTTAFINSYGIERVLNDFQRTVSSRFQSGGQPIFAIINGVENSPSHQQWELLYTRLGFGDNQHPITTFRQAIDSVQAALNIDPPTISTNPSDARIATGSPLTLSVQANGDDLTYLWKKDGTALSGQTTATLNIASASLSDAGSYTVTVSNPGGDLSSSAAQIEVVVSLTDYLTNSGLNGDNLAPDADPDHDGHPNAFEYLAQSNPNDGQDTPIATLQYIESGGVPTIRIQIATGTDTLGFSLAAQFIADPPEAGRANQEIPIGQNSEVLQIIPANAKTFLARLVATPIAN